MNVIIFGCGQAGQMVANWLSAGCRLIAYADNNIGRQGGYLDGVPIIAPNHIPDYAPDLVWIAVLNREAASSIELQLRRLGYRGEIQSLTPLRSAIDLRLAQLRLIARELKKRPLMGAVAELGVYQGAFAAEINRLFPDRKLYLFDTFEGFPAKDLAIEAQILAETSCSLPRRNFADTDVDSVLSHLPHPEQAVVCRGYFPDSLPEELPDFVFVSLDPDLYEPTRQGLAVFWPRLVPGGIILIHDYNSTQFPGVGQAVREFCEENRLTVMPLADLHGSAVLMKQG